MADLLFTLHCSVPDTEALIEAVRCVSGAPLHIRTESVRGRDYGDAGMAERVSGALRRTTIEWIIDADDVPELLQVVEKCRHNLPVRWRTTAIASHGRIG